VKKSAFGIFSVIVLAGSFLVAEGVNRADAEAVDTSTGQNVSIEKVVPDPTKIPVVDRDTDDDSFASGVSGAEIIIPEPTPAPVKKVEESQEKNSSSNNSENVEKDDKSKSVDSSESSDKPKPSSSTWDSCINRVDPHRSVDWRIGSYGYYGQASTNYVLLGNHTPDHRKCAVVYHEWFHTVHARKEGGMENIINTYGRNRLESITDCGALMLGADWVGYGCNNDTDRQKAREILGW